MDWDKATDVILYASIAILLVFAILAVYQWHSRGSFKKIDRELRWFPLPLAIMSVIYFIFDKILIWNTRPNGSGEPSFPSSHVMVVATIFFIVTLILPKYVKNRWAAASIEIVMLILVVLTCIGRILANMHWLSDVLGAIIFAFIFSEIYYLIIKKGGKNAKHLHKDH